MTTEINLKRVQDFNAFMIERHNMFIKKEINNEPYPWSEDSILTEYSFCNVYRELDRVTIWIRENWREPYADHPNLPFAMAVARQINWPDTLEEIGFPEEWRPQHVKNIMQDRMARKEKVYTGAYMLTGTLGGTKVEQTVDKILTPLYANFPCDFSSLENCWKSFLPYAGFSDFMSYEVVTDLRHTKWLCKAPDIMVWANPGPGAMRGLNRIFGRPLDSKQKKPLFIQEMRDLLALLNNEPLPLEMRDIEHCLCEFDKYERARLGQGKPRAKYKPREYEEDIL
tara:strand:+ start:195 stop:1043 length:849 start_codon:yes stop_codon:yes gene_type:complete